MLVKGFLFGFCGILLHVGFHKLRLKPSISFLRNSLTISEARLSLKFVLEQKSYSSFG